PGPPGLPLIGNLLSLPKERPWVQMEKWSREYGPIYRLQLGSRNFIVLGTAKAAYDLLDKRSAIYSSRPRQIMTSELVSRGLRMTFMQYTDLWKRERKLLHQLTQPKAAASYEPIQDAESAWLLKDLLENPNDAWGHGQRYAGSTIMQIAFNKRALKHTDRAITEMRRVNDLMARTAVPGAYLVDSFPLINYLPKFLAPWKREADEIFEDTLELFRSHVNDVRQNVDQHCFAKYILELQAEYGLSEPEATFLAGAMYGAGSDTTSDMISTFIFCMAYRPDVVDKAHEELDRVIGQDRMPDFPDENSLPYVQAVIQECLRWRSVIAGGLAH
ncbi:cytochrome P450, partial [Atractiella rhizophila]